MPGDPGGTELDDQAELVDSPAAVAVEVIEPTAEPVAEPIAEVPSGPSEPTSDRPPYFPLRRRGRNLRDAKHAAYYDAPNPVEGLAAAYDYFRAACTRAVRGGMPIPAADDALIDIGRALMAEADRVTAAMHTWRRPES